MTGGPTLLSVGRHSTDESSQHALQEAAFRRWRGKAVALVPQLPVDVRGQLARYAWTPHDVLAILAEDPEAGVVAAVSGNPSVPDSVAARALARLLGESEYRSAAIRDPRTPMTPDQLADLLPEVAENPALPVDVQRRVASGPDTAARRYLASNRAIDAAALALIATDPEPGTLARLASNPSVPSDVLRRLAEATVPPLAAGRRAEFRRARRDGLRIATHSTYYGAVVALLAHPNMPPDAAADLAQRLIAAGWLLATEWEGTPPARLASLAKRGVLMERRHAAANPMTPAAALAVLAGSNDHWVRRGLLQNPSCPPEPLAQLVLSLVREGFIHERSSEFPTDRPDLPGWFITTCAALPRPGEALVESQQAWVGRIGIARSPHTPEDLLRALAELALTTGHGYVAVQLRAALRAALAGNPSTPESVLNQLLAVGDMWVRASLAANPALPSGVVATLAEDGTGLVRAVLARQPSVATDPAVAQLLLADRDACARGSQGLRETVDGAVRILATMLGNDWLPQPAQLADALDARHGEVGKLVLAHPGLEIEHLFTVMAASALSRGASDGILGFDLIDRAQDRQRIMSDQASPPAWRFRIAASEPRRRLADVLVHPDASVRMVAFLHKGSDEYLAQLLADPDPQVAAVAAERVLTALAR